jgi:hypothetical protein
MFQNQSQSRGAVSSILWRVFKKHLDASFPLTPALSPAEREKRSQRLGETTPVFCSIIVRVSENIQRLFPLSKGEG